MYTVLEQDQKSNRCNNMQQLMVTDSHTPNLEMLLYEFTLNSIRKMGFECIFYNIRKIGYDCMLNSIRKVGYEHKLNCIRKWGMSVDSITNFCCTILHAA